MANLGSLAISVGADMSAFNAAMGGVGDRIRAAAKDAETAWAPIAQIGSGLMGIGASMSAAITVPLAGAAAAAISLGESLNLAEMSFTTMLGSGKAAAAFLEELKQFAVSTPFEFPDLVEASKRMMAMGFAAKDVIPTMRIVGDSVAALGGGRDVINGVTLALGQMQAKGKVSAQEMNQLAERGIPAWEFLAKTIGVSIPEAMKMAETGAIKSAEAIPAILSGMQQKFGGQMQQMAGTLTGTWSNFKDQLGLIGAQIGQSLVPALTSLVRAAMPVLDWVKEAADWFARLPEPAKNFGLALAATAAAIGPLVLGLGGLMTAVGTLAPLVTTVATAVGVGTTALLGWVAAIPLAVAALAALGTWVYANWEPIKATVLQAWDGVTEIWSAAWGGIVGMLTPIWQGISGAANAVFGPIWDFLSTLWDGLAPIFSAAWNGIKGALVTVWEAIKSSASAVWGGIVSVFQTFLEWAKKIPGVNKLFNLDEAWSAAKKLSAETDKAAKSTEGLKKEADKAAGSTSRPIPKLSKSIKDVGTEARASETKITPVIRKYTELTAESERLEKQHRSAIKEVANLKAKLSELGDEIPDVQAPLLSFNQTMADMALSADDLANLKIPKIGDAFDLLKGTTDSLKTAMSELGVKSTAEYQKVADEAKRAYEAVAGNVLATPTDKNNAMLAMMKAQAEAMKANGEQIPKDMQAMLEELSAKTGEALPKEKGKWSDWSKQVSTIITDLGRDIAGLLFDGEKSWAEKGKAALKSLGEAVTRSFVEPATAALGDFISGVLADLMGGKGFGGIIDRVKEVGKTISGVFGGGASAAGNVAGGAGSAGGSAGGIGGGAGAAAGSGTAAIVGAVGGVVSAISGVIGNFQMAGMNKTLDLLEKAARYSESHLLQIVTEAQQYWPQINALNDAFQGTFMEAFANQMSTTEGISERMHLAVGRLTDISTDMVKTADYAAAGNSLLTEIRDAVRVKQMPNVNITVAGAASPQATADAIATTLRTQFAF